MVMNFFDFEQRLGSPEKGRLLVASPFLNDTNFTRSVILLCEHNEQGSIGFILNQPMNMALSDVAEGLDTIMPTGLLHHGGPVEADTLHILHRLPHILGGVHVTGNIYWGGSYNALTDMIKNSHYRPDDIRLVVGYSGWEPGQLTEEIESKTWIVADAIEDIIFRGEAQQVWQRAVRSLGSDFAHLLNTPINAQMN